MEPKSTQQQLEIGSVNPVLSINTIVIFKTAALLVQLIVLLAISQTVLLVTIYSRFKWLMVLTDVLISVEMVSL